MAELSRLGRSTGDLGRLLNELEHRDVGLVIRIGLVKSAEQLGGHSIEIRSARRIVMAFDPETDDVGLLRTVVQLIRLSAISASARHDVAEIHTAHEKLIEAAGLLVKVDEIRRVAGLIRNHGAAIERDSDSFRTEIARLLDQAQTALRAAVPGTATAGAA